MEVSSRGVSAPTTHAHSSSGVLRSIEQMHGETKGNACQGGIAKRRGAHTYLFGSSAPWAWRATSERGAVWPADATFFPPGVRLHSIGPALSRSARNAAHYGRWEVASKQSVPRSGIISLVLFHWNRVARMPQAPYFWGIGGKQNTAFI
ncbi:hypothetical protein AVEN_260644-1 [Araneus ventricosus]|uniref:Uncharacterized protein n=1 Tax=Araneus ventricosus TaxID=182803 RepID=A0A4Y2RRU5_ARAVE|nr:hypothetical protein AVEN_260644-1 [Araneus ventricosus]